MTATYTLIDDDYGLRSGSDTSVDVIIKMNFGNPYASGGHALSAAVINAALLAGGHKAHETVSSVDAVIVGGPSLDGTVIGMWDSANSKVKAFSPSAVTLNAGSLPSLTAPTIAWSDALTVTDHVATLPAGTYALAVEATAGLTAPCYIQQTAAGATQEVDYDPAARTLTFLAADTVTECRALLYTPPSLSAGTLPTINESGGFDEYGAVDLSAAAKGVYLHCRCTRSA